MMESLFAVTVFGIPIAAVLGCFVAPEPRTALRGMQWSVLVLSLLIFGSLCFEGEATHSFDAPEFLALRSVIDDGAHVWRLGVDRHLWSLWIALQVVCLLLRRNLEGEWEATTQSSVASTTASSKRIDCCWLACLLPLGFVGMAGAQWVWLVVIWMWLDRLQGTGFRASTALFVFAGLCLAARYGSTEMSWLEAAMRNDQRPDATSVQTGLVVMWGLAIAWRAGLFPAVLPSERRGPQMGAWLTSLMLALVFAGRCQRLWLDFPEAGELVLALGAMTIVLSGFAASCVPLIEAQARREVSMRCVPVFSAWVLNSIVTGHRELGASESLVVRIAWLASTLAPGFISFAVVRARWAMPRTTVSKRPASAWIDGSLIAAGCLCVLLSFEGLWMQWGLFPAAIPLGCLGAILAWVSYRIDPQIAAIGSRCFAPLIRLARAEWQIPVIISGSFSRPLRLCGVVLEWVDRQWLGALKPGTWSRSATRAADFSDASDELSGWHAITPIVAAVVALWLLLMVR